MGKILENTGFYLIKKKLIMAKDSSQYFTKAIDLLEVCWGNKNGMNLMVEGKDLPYLTLPKVFTCKLKMISSVSPSFFIRGTTCSCFTTVSRCSQFSQLLCDLESSSLRIGKYIIPGLPLIVVKVAAPPN